MTPEERKAAIRARRAQRGEALPGGLVGRLRAERKERELSASRKENADGLVTTAPTRPRRPGGGSSKPVRKAKAKPKVSAPYDTERRRAVQKAAAHGTPSGYQRHYKLGEEPCSACRLAWNAHRREAYRRNRKPVERKRAPCGTPAGYGHHLQDKEEPCAECRDARNAYKRGEWKGQLGNNGKAPAKCGTASGYQRHRRLGETPCEPCRAEHARLGRRRYHRAQGKEAGFEGQAQGAKPRKPLSPCGTAAAYRRHKKAGETPCDPCRLAYNAFQTARRRRAGVEPLNLKPCGTEAAYQRHLTSGEPACQDCLDAAAARRRERYHLAKSG